MKSFLGLVLFMTALQGQVAPQMIGQALEPTVSIQWGEKIPMRDGVNLSCVVFRPSNQAQPLPVILASTPYTLNESLYDRGCYFARNGYVFVAVDVRGRGDSEGSFAPFVQELTDGFDSVEWLARQPWCNGKVGMTGGSYLGGDQWATAKMMPPHLATMVPVAAVHPGVDMPTIGGIDFMQTMQWLVKTSGRTRKSFLYSDDELSGEIIRNFARSGRAFQDLDSYLGLPSSTFQTWVKHPSRDEYWDAAVPKPEQYRRLDIPILTITGHYDDDQLGALTYYRDHLRYASDVAKERHFLVIGPWDHSGTGKPAKEFAGAQFGPAAMVDMKGLHKAWFDWTIKGGPKPPFLKKRVACYVQGKDSWQYADRLENLSPAPTTFYLQGNGNSNSQIGKLQTSPSGSHSGQRITHDPLDPDPLQWDREPSKAGLLTLPGATMIMDNRQFHHRALSFQSEPMMEGTTIIGSPTLSIWVRMDVPDADFFASLFEVKPDGSVLQLTRDVLRARYRESFRIEKLVAPGEPTRLVFRNFLTTAKAIGKGSRLKLVFGLMDMPAAQRNYHSGKPVSGETPQDARVAHVDVLNEEGHMGYLELPLEQFPQQ